MRVGQKSIRLTALRPIAGGKFWLCRCQCGKTTKVSKWHFERKLRKSCGCRLKPRPHKIKCLNCRTSKQRLEFYLRRDGSLSQRTCKVCVRRVQRQKSVKTRLDRRLCVLRHYSNGKLACKCCNEHRIEFLHLDHSNGDGAKWRKKFKSHQFYQWLIRNRFPDDLGLRVLCANCNMARGLYGYCPHEREP